MVCQRPMLARSVREAIAGVGQIQQDSRMQRAPAVSDKSTTALTICVVKILDELCSVTAIRQSQRHWRARVRGTDGLTISRSSHARYRSSGVMSALFLTSPVPSLSTHCPSMTMTHSRIFSASVWPIMALRMPVSRSGRLPSLISLGQSGRGCPVRRARCPSGGATGSDLEREAWCGVVWLRFDLRLDGAGSLRLV